MEDLRNRNAILTGASRGLGVHLARALAREGVNLVLVARSPDALKEVRDEVISLGVDAWSCPTDLAENGDVENLAQAAGRRLGPEIAQAHYSPEGHPRRSPGGGSHSEFGRTELRYETVALRNAAAPRSSIDSSTRLSMR
jgi:NAD(P)-dependent dehydrogenase (short-subunit alcohol dehydrogenase family)